MFCIEGGVAAEITPRAECAGWIEALTGKVYWAQAARAKPVILSSSRDRYRRLYAGERVKVDAGGKLHLMVYGQTIDLKGPTGWYPIPFVPSFAQSAQMALLRDYARIGGRERYGSSIFSPASNSVVQPEELVLQWVPQRFSGTLTLAIQDEDGRDLWHQVGVTPVLGILDAPAVRQALVAYRDSNNSRPLVFAILSQDGNSDQVSFSLLSASESPLLAHELDRWSHENGLTRHLGRIDVFTQFKMYNNVALEYEAALRDAPESQDLLLAGIAANQQIGNNSHVKELARRLALLTKMSK